MEFTMQLRPVAARTKKRPTWHSRKFGKRARKRQHGCTHNDKCVCQLLRPASFQFPKIWQDLLQKHQLCDGVLRCQDGTEYKIHRAILSAASPYFRALFTNSINRCNEEAHEANVRASELTIHLFLDFAYTGSCHLTARNVQDLLKFADQYAVLGLVQQCCKYLLDNLNPANCLAILRFASEYFCTELVKRGRTYVQHHFTEVYSLNKDFVLLERKELLDILSRDELNVKTEELVFQAICMWVSHDPRRKTHLYDLLKCVRLGMLELHCLEVIVRHELIKDQLDCKEYIVGVMVKKETAEQLGKDQLSIEHPAFRPRVSYDVLFAIGGWSTGTPTNLIETYDVRANKWLLSGDTDMCPKAYHGVCLLNNVIYVVGGFDGSRYYNSVRRFDPVTRKWSECACMYHIRCYVSTVVAKGQMYAIGGYNGRTRMSSAERYNATKNQWELIPSMGSQRSDASAAVLDEKIYIVGGFNGEQVMSSVEMFNIQANQWTYVREMSSSRSGVSLVAMGKVLYALGGFSGYERLATGEQYVAEENRWSPIAPMSTSRSNFATAVLDDFIYVIGGFNDHSVAGSSTINHVEYYDPANNEWDEGSPMQLNRSALSACVVSGLPNGKEYSAFGRNHKESSVGKKEL